MKFTKKLIAVIIAMITAFSPCISSVAVNSENQCFDTDIVSLNEYRQKIRDDGYPVFTTDQFLTITNVFKWIFRIISGRFLYSDEYLDVDVDELVTEACNYVYSNCGLDIVALLTGIPDINNFAEFAAQIFNIDTAEFRNQMYSKRDEFSAEGNDVMSTICNYLGAYMSIIDKLEVFSDVTGSNPNVYEVMIRIVYRDGGYDIAHTGIYINIETGECTNYNNSGLSGTGFNFNLSEMLVYATMDAWMRDFGFCLFYDVAAGSMPLLWNYNTRRFKFDYNGLEWMIQIWKGNYLITNGGEVGVYNRTSEKFGSFYYAATNDQLMEMTLQIYHGEDLLVNQEPQMHWWINGFQMSDRIYIPDSLTLKSSIVMPDEEMLNAFCEAIDSHYRKDVSYTVEGLTVYFVW